MKHLKMLVVAAAATAAMTAALGAGTASATVLCKTTTTPCGSPYAKGTVLVPSLTGSNQIETLGGTNLVTCTATSTKITIENSGGAASTVSGPITELAASGCTTTVQTLKPGSVEIHHIAGTDNGTVTGLFSEITTMIFGVSCIYGAGTSIDAGTLTGGENPTLKVNEIIKRMGGAMICPAEVRWTASYNVTSPKPLYVEAS